MNKEIKALVIAMGTAIPESTVPESFKVLLKELNSLGLDVIPVDPKEVMVADESIEELEKDKVILTDDPTITADDSGVAGLTTTDPTDDKTTVTKDDPADLDEIEEPTDEELKKTEGEV